MDRLRLRHVARFALLVGGMAVLNPLSVQAAATTATRTVSVSGEGEAMAKPDQARLSAGVVTMAPTAAAAMAANNAAMARVLAALRGLSIPENKIQTSNFSVQPQYRENRTDSSEPRNVISAYQVSNQVSVTIDDIAKLGPALDVLVRNGANQLGGVSFAIANPAPLAERARAAAVSDAAAKARTLAAAAGVSLGPLLSIQEGGAARPLPMFALQRAELAAAAAPIAIGEDSVRASVSLVYAIQ